MVDAEAQRQHRRVQRQRQRDQERLQSLEDHRDDVDQVLTQLENLLQPELHQRPAFIHYQAITKPASASSNA